MKLLKHLQVELSILEHGFTDMLIFVLYVFEGFESS